MVPSGSQRVRTCRVLDEKGTKKFEILRLKGLKKLSGAPHLHVLQPLISQLPKPFSKNTAILSRCVLPFTSYRWAKSSPRLGGKTYGGDSLPGPKLIDRATLRGLGNHKNGYELGRGGSPRADIKPGRSYRLQDAI